MPLADCQERTSVSKIKVEERGRKAIFLNPNGEEYIKTKVDGCLLINQLASDWIVSKATAGDVIVELKGVDVAHGIKQVLATAQYWHLNGHRAGRLAALIVCRQYPKIATVVQRGIAALTKQYQAPLHIVARNAEYSIDHVLSRNGPFN